MVLVAPLWFNLAFGIALGSVFGSFLNVVIYRLPRGLSVVSPPSACPSCSTRIAPYDNVPVLGWMWLRGKCRSCRVPISPRYPAVEALTAGLFALVLWRFGFSWEALPALFFVATMVVVTLIDFDAMIIPDRITIPGTFLGIAASFLTRVSLTDSLIGAVAGFGFLYLVAWGYQRVTGRDGLGGGDIKFAAMLGAFLGWQGMLLTIFLASLGGTVIGVIVIARTQGNGKTMLPFGTFLAPAAVVVALWGDDLVRAYLGMFA